MLQSFSTDVPFRGLSAAPFTGTPPCVLGKRTVVYGRNGSGKTTLTEALRLASTVGKADRSTVKARVVTGGASSSIDLGPEALPFRLFVYNRYYVLDALHLFLDGTGEALPILKLGAENVQAAKEIRALQDYLLTLEQRQKDLAGAVRSIESDRDTIEKQVKADIIADLAAADGQYYNTTRYSVTLVRQRLEDSSAVVLDTDALAAELAAAKAPSLGEVRVPTGPGPVAPTLHTTINSELLAATVESVQLPRLAGNPSLSDWIEAGLSLHQAGDTCAFCQSGTVTAATLDAYRQHFSEALEALRDRMTKAIAYLEGQVRDLDTWVSGLPTDDTFLPDFRDRARTAREPLTSSVEALKTALNNAASAIRKRLADPLNPLPVSEHLADAFPTVNQQGFSEVVTDNNAASASQADRIKQAKFAVETHHGAVRGTEYRKLGSRLALGQRAGVALKARQNTVQDALVALEQSQQDVGRMANLIDADLADHFGHAHLRVGVSSDGKGYIVTRGGDIAERLSEGERNAIAFTYFLRSLEASGVDPTQSVVVIDDPVTSLDKEALFAAFALAEARTEGFAQTVVLTHDYEYFRLQLMENASKWHSSQKRLQENNPAEKLMPEVSLLEIRAIAPAGQNERHGEVRQMPRSLIQHPSEYHFLFLHVAEAVLGTSGEYLPLVGNAGRRLLEGFLSFRAPSKIKFQEKVDAVASAASIDASLKERVVKFLHSQSHREEPRPSAALDFPSIEAELVAALTFIYKADATHFIDMCKAVDLDPAVILQSFASHGEINVSTP